MLNLYQVEWCPSCHGVRQALTELGLTYVAVNVPCKRDERAQVMAVSGQSGVPVLQDGDRVLTDSTVIIDYLRATYPQRSDSDEHAARGAWRIMRQLSISPHATLSRLRQLLLDQGYEILFEAGGSDIGDALPRDYVLLGVLARDTASQAYECDARAPSALVMTIAVAPEAGGASSVTAADPVSVVWLYANAPLRRVQAAAKQRLAELLAAI